MKGVTEILTTKIVSIDPHDRRTRVQRIVCYIFKIPFHVPNNFSFEIRTLADVELCKNDFVMDQSGVKYVVTDLISHDYNGTLLWKLVTVMAVHETPSPSILTCLGSTFSEQ